MTPAPAGGDRWQNRDLLHHWPLLALHTSCDSPPSAAGHRVHRQSSRVSGAHLPYTRDWPGQPITTRRLFREPWRGHDRRRTQRPVTSALYHYQKRRSKHEKCDHSKTFELIMPFTAAQALT